MLGSDWEGRLATFIAALRKRLSGDFEVDEFGFDPQITEILTGAVEPLAEKWFRLEVRGIENIPAEGGALLVANHSGTVPIDGIITGYAVKKYSGRNLRPLGADLVFALPFIGQLARKVGATLACTADAERLLTGGELAAVWPEGFKGIGKPFSERYKLQRFGRGGFVSSAMRARCRSSRSRSWAPRRSTRWSATCRHWPACSASRTCRSRRSSRCSVRSA